MAIVWQPDNRIRPSPHSPNAWDVDTGPLRAALAGWRTGRPTVAVWGPHGTRVTQQLDRLVWIMADGSRVPIASAGPAQESTSAPNVLRVSQAVGGVEDVWEVQGNRLKHTWQVPHLVVPDGAVSLAMEGTLILQGVTMAVPEGRSAGAIGLYHPSQAAPVMEIARGEAVDDAEGARTHVAYEWHPSLREAANGAVVKDSRKVYITTLVDADWIRSLQGGFSIDPTISTSTSSVATAYPNQRREVRCSNGNVVSIFMDGDTLKMAVTTDAYQSAPTITTIGPAYAQAGAHIEIDSGDHLYIWYRQPASGSNYLQFNRGTPNAGRTAWTWETPSTLSTAGQGDLFQVGVLNVDGTSIVAHSFWSAYDGSQFYLRYARVTIAAGGTRAVSGVTALAGPYAVHVYPTACPIGTAQVAVNWTTGAAAVGFGVRCRIGTIAAGNTTAWSAVEVVTESYYAATGEMGANGADSQGRLVVIFQAWQNRLCVFRRGAAGGWTDISPGGGNRYNPTLSIGTDDSIYTFFTASGLLYRKYDGASWGSEVVADSTTSAAYPSARRETTGSAADALYTTGTSPYVVQHFRLTLNQPPSKPTGLTRANYDAAQDAVFAWTHVDPDGNAQASRQVQIIRADTGATVYDSGKVATATQSMTLLANTLTSPRQYQWRVMTWDTADAASPWSDYATFHCSAAPTVAVTFPATDGDTVTSSEVTAQGTITDPESEGSSAWQWWLLDSADTVLWTSGKVNSTAPPLHSVTDLANGGSYKLQLQGWDAKGVASPVVTRGFVVSYTAPADPDALTVTPLPGRASNRITWQAPASPAGVESGTYHISRRRADEPDTAYRTLATNWPTTTYEDHTAASGQEYVYRVLSIGTNGVLSDGSTLTLTGAQTEG